MDALKNKKSVALLLVVVIIVWGLIIYRVVVYSGGGGIVAEVKGKKHVVVTEKRDTLYLNYRDPFLGTIPRSVIPPTTKVRNTVVVEEVDMPPTFRIAGKIRKGKRDFWLVETGDDTRLISAKEKYIDGYRVVKAFPDSVCLRKGNKIYTLRIE